MKKFGIDVSAHQKNIDWNKVKNNIEFAVIRAGYGKEISQHDDCYTDYLELVKKAGLNGYTDSDTVEKSETTLKKSKNISLAIDDVIYLGKITRIQHIKQKL